MLRSAVNVNDDVRHFFQTKKRLSTRDSLSPILFNIVVDMLAVLIRRANEDGWISVVPHPIDMQMIQFYFWIMTWRRLKT